MSTQGSVRVSADGGTQGASADDSLSPASDDSLSHASDDSLSRTSFSLSNCSFTDGHEVRGKVNRVVARQNLFSQ